LRLAIQDDGLHEADADEEEGEESYGIGPARVLATIAVLFLAMFLSGAGWDFLLYDYRYSRQLQYAAIGTALVLSALVIAIAGLHWFAGWA